MKMLTGAIAASLISVSSSEMYGFLPVEVEHRCQHVPTSARPPQWGLSREGLPAVYSGAPASYEISGIAESNNPFIGVGDFKLLVKVKAFPPDPSSTPVGDLDQTEFELDLCTDVVGVECPLAVGDEFSGIVTWNAMGMFPRCIEEPCNLSREDFVAIFAIQPEGPFCGHSISVSHEVLDTPSEASGDLLWDHLSALIEEDNDGTTWQKGHSPRFEAFSWDDARRIAGGTVMRGHRGFEDLPRRTYTKKTPSFATATSGGDSPAALSGRRRLTATAEQDIPASFDGREAFSECSSVIGRVRDQSDCGSCWAFASTEAFNDRRCIAGIGKGDGAITDQLSVLSAEDTTACCYGFHCGLSMGCNGGQPGSAWKWFTRTGVVSGGDYDDIGTGETCKPYEFMPCAHHVDPGASGYPACPDSEYPTPECLSECSDTSFNGGTYAEDKKKAKEAYSLAGVEDIQLDMMKYGSVTAAFSVYSDFLTYAGGVYSNKSGHYMGGHAVKIIGWGTDEDSGEDYWLVANSWNPSWGEDGLFRILRGVNECGIEGQIVAGEV